MGLGWGGDKWGAGEVLEGFAVDAGQQPRNTHERETNRNSESRRELPRGHWDKPRFLGRAVGTSHSDHGRVSDKLSSACFTDKIQIGGVRRVQGMES